MHLLYPLCMITDMNFNYVWIVSVCNVHQEKVLWCNGLILDIKEIDNLLRLED